MGTSTENVRVVISAKDKASGVLNKLKSNIVAAAAGFAAFQLGKSIMTSIIRKTLETERIYNKLSQALEHHGFQWKLVEASVRSFTGAMQTATGMSDELIAEGLQKLVSYGMTVPAAMDAMKSSMDLAVGGGMDLKAAIDLIGKASVGYTSTLSRYGIILDETIPKEEKFALALEKINEMFGGSAQAQMETTIGQWNRLSEAVGDLMENIGKSEGGVFKEFIEGSAKLVEGFNAITQSSVSWFDTIKAGVLGQLGLFEQTIANIRTFEAEQSEADANMAQATLEAAASAALALENKVVINQLASEKIVLIWADANDLMENDDNEQDEHNTYMAVQRLKRIAKARKQEFVITSAALKKEVAAFKQAEREKRSARDQSMREYGAQTAKFVNGVISSFGKTKREADQIWKDMAKAFIEFFIKKALFALTGPAGFGFKMVSALRLFDIPANDRMAMKMGGDYVKFFGQGAMNAVNDFNTSFVGALTGLSTTPAFAGGSALSAAVGPSQGSIINNIYISGSVDESMVRNVLAPVLSDLAANNYTNISFDPQTTTSEAAVELA